MTQNRQHSAAFMNVDVVDSVKSNTLLPRLFNRLPSLDTLNDSSSLITFFLSGLPVGPPSVTDLYQYLVDLIAEETHDFLQDFVDTDEAVGNTAAPGSKPLLTAGPEVGSSSSTNKNDDVPIAELILASHAVLLLHTLTIVTLNDPADPDTGRIAGRESGKGKALSRNGSTSSALIPSKTVKEIKEDEVSYEFVVYDVRARLPRHSWWLGIRILKAFMALQLQVSQFFHFCGLI